MKNGSLRNLGFLALVLVVLGAGAQKASAEIEYDTYLHCGEYLGADPYVNLIRYAPNEDFLNAKPMWSFSYGTKNPVTKVRMEVSCLIREVSEDADGKVVFAGENCDVVLSQEADKSFSISYDGKSKITGCVFDLPRERSVGDLEKDIATSGVDQGGLSR